MTDAPQPLLEVAVRHHRAGRLEQAEAIYRNILKDAPGDTTTLHFLGLLLHKTGRSAEGLQLIRQAIAGNDKVPAYHVSLATILDAGGDPAGAVAAYRRAIALAPDDVDCHIGLGLLLHEQGDTDAAAEEYRRALALDPARTAIKERLLDAAAGGLFFGRGSGFQGAHAPERQVFMSAAVWLKRRLDHPIRILEVGSYMGASAITWARAIDAFMTAPGYLLCVDPWTDSHVDEQYRQSDDSVMSEMVQFLGRSGSAYRAFLRNVATAPRSVTIEHRRGNSTDILPSLPAGSFDIVYIDGSHFYEDVAADLRNGDRLLCSGGFLCGDDLELQGDQCDLAHARQHLRTDYIFDPGSGAAHHPGVTLAVHEFLGKVSAYAGFWIMQKTAAGYAPVDLKHAEGLLPLHWPRSITEKLRARFAGSGELRAVRG